MALPFTPPEATLRFMAANCADSMLAILVAVALSKNFWKFARLTVPSRLPLALRRHNASTPGRRFGGPVITLAPFLFDQKPSVRPPPAPRQTLPNCTVVVPPSTTTACWIVKVVLRQFN